MSRQNRHRNRCGLHSTCERIRFAGSHPCFPDRPLQYGPLQRPHSQHTPAPATAGLAAHTHTCGTLTRSTRTLSAHTRTRSTRTWPMAMHTCSTAPATFTSATHTSATLTSAIHTYSRIGQCAANDPRENLPRHGRDNTCSFLHFLDALANTAYRNTVPWNGTLAEGSATPPSPESVSQGKRDAEYTPPNENCER